MSINTTTETYDSFIKNIIETRGQFGCGEEYHERHHIIPKCLGGSNDKSNLIDLFAREHFIAHRLLALENPNKKQLTYSWWMMSYMKSNKKQKRYKLTPEEYEESRTAFSKAMSAARIGYKPSAETRRKIGEAGKGKSHLHTDETKRILSENHSGAKHPRARSVIQYDISGNFIRVWDYAKQVEEQINIRYSNILECCKGKRATAGGFRWGYND